MKHSIKVAKKAQTEPVNPNLLFVSGLGFLILCLGTIMGCQKGLQNMNITKQPFGKTTDGKPVDIYALVNKNGSEIRITNYGGIIQSLKVPDRYGNLGDVVLGYDTLDKYIENSPYFGALIGRYGNRIGKGKFVLDGKTYTLATNNNENHLHGGNVGFDKVVWEAKKISEDGYPGLKLSYLSKDGEEGYPGNLKVTVKYIWTDNDELKIEYKATTDKPTVVNLTSHSYFNLAGEGDILKHELMINANRFTPVESGLIPTGEIFSVAGTPFDFRTPKAIGKDINADDQQIEYGSGYDHNFILNKERNQLALAAEVYDPETGRDMQVWTTEPGLQFYSGNFLDDTMKGKGGWVYQKYDAFCLESQHYPDSPNNTAFPTTTLNPGDTYSTTTIYKFTTK